MKPLISVVLPVYNSEKHIDQAIHSILDQSFKDFELIIIDDGSSDATHEHIRQFEDPRIRFIQHAKNEGISKSLNDGIRASRTDVIARMDADDVSLTRRLEIQYRFLTEHPDVDVLGTSYLKINEKEEVLGEVVFFEEDEQIKRHMSLAPREAFMSHPSLMIRKESLLKAGLYDEEFRTAQDKDLLIRMAFEGFRFANLNESFLMRLKAPGPSTEDLKDKEHDLWRTRVYELHRNGLRRICRLYRGLNVPNLERRNHNTPRLNAHSRLYMQLGRGLDRMGDKGPAREAYLCSLAANPHRVEAYEAWLQSVRPGVLGSVLRGPFVRKIMTRVLRHRLLARHAARLDRRERLIPGSHPGAVLRLAFVTNEFIVNRDYCSGLSNYLNRLTQVLADHGHEIHVVAYADSDVAHPDQRIHLHGIQPIPKESFVRWIGIKMGLYGFMIRLHFNWKVYRTLQKLDQKRRLNLIQYTNVYASGLVSARGLDIPHVLRLSSDRLLWQQWSRNPRLDKTLCAWMESLQIKQARRLYAPSRTLQGWLRTKYPVKQIDLIRTPAFLETNDPDPAVQQRFEDKEVLLYFGGFKSSKGFHHLCEMLPDFLKRFPNAHAVLIGKDRIDEIQPSMKAHAQSKCAGVSDRLHILDPLPHRELYPVIAGAKTVVLPSVFDNLPNTCLEAMSLSKVVIGTKGSSLDELITDGVNGFLAESYNPEDLLQKAVTAWTHPDLQGIGDRAKHRMKDFAPGKVIPGLLALYRGVIRGWDSPVIHKKERLFAEIKREACGMMPPHVYNRIHDYAREAIPGNMIEIGAAQGAATVSLGLALKKRRSPDRLYSFEKCETSSALKSWSSKPANLDVLHQNLERYHVRRNVCVIPESFYSGFGSIRDRGPFALLLIDADGRIDETFSTVYNWLKPGAFVIIDDYENKMSIPKAIQDPSGIDAYLRRKSVDDLSRLCPLGKHYTTFRLVNHFVKIGLLEEIEVPRHTWFGRKPLSVAHERAWPDPGAQAIRREILAEYHEALNGLPKDKIMQGAHAG